MCYKVIEVSLPLPPMTTNRFFVQFPILIIMFVFSAAASILGFTYRPTSVVQQAPEALPPVGELVTEEFTEPRFPFAPQEDNTVIQAGDRIRVTWPDYTQEMFYAEKLGLVGKKPNQEKLIPAKYIFIEVNPKEQPRVILSQPGQVFIQI
jgi:hypothetical protein